VSDQLRALDATEPLKPEKVRQFERVKRIVRLMEGSIGIPGTRFRFGLDPLLGLIFGGGDLASFLISVYLLWESRKLGISNRALGKMLANIVVDFIVGCVPIVGDIFDFAFRANSRNLRLLETELNREPDA